MAPNMILATEGTPRRPFNNASRPNIAALNAPLENAETKAVTTKWWFNIDLFGVYRDREIG